MASRLHRNPPEETKSMNNQALVFIRFLAVDVVMDVLRFPLWWYSRGVVRGAQWWRRQLKNGSDLLAITVLAKNLGRPMFGDYTREGRAISFGVRIVQLTISTVLYLAWLAVTTILWLCWFLLLPAVIVFFLYELSHA